tara:strand:- start:19975 stop:20247 length:273 start_codon:yes stop_codon:yes gene_type:complete
MIPEIEEMYEESKIVYNSMYWSYMLLTKKITFDELIERDEEFGLIYNPDELTELTPEVKIDLINVLIEYFVEEEEYEKCQELVNAKKLYK